MNVYEKAFCEQYKEHNYFYLTAESCSDVGVDEYSDYFTRLDQARKAAKKLSKDLPSLNVYVEAIDFKTKESMGCLVYSEGKYQWSVM